MTPKKVIEFKSKSKGKKKDSKDGEISDHGTIGDLKYEVYSRGTIHIFDNKHMFKKDCSRFEDAINEINFNKITEKSPVSIPGSGDNDDIQFYMENGDIKIKLIGKPIAIVEKLKSILKTGQKN